MKSRIHTVIISLLCWPVDDLDDILESLADRRNANRDFVIKHELIAFLVELKVSSDEPQV